MISDKFISTISSENSIIAKNIKKLLDFLFFL